MKLKSISLLALIAFFQISFAQQIGSWGDQGDGTYRNPILNADYPDVDVEKHGDTYFMISSKQHMSPGMVILESKDMVNWITIGHVWDSLSWAPEYNWDQMNGYSFGVWAGDLAYHDGWWYCYMIDYDHGLLMSRAPDIRGPWTQPHSMISTKLVLDDPAVFWDDERHEAYLICNTANKQRMVENKVPGNENRLYRMSWDGKEILDEGKVVYTGQGAEAAKIYKINKMWYIFLGEWFLHEPKIPGRIDVPENDRKQIVLRSTTNSIYGPYEKRIGLERGNGIVRSCSQGALMQAPDSSWWYLHQLIQNVESPFQGRPQCLEPVTWLDGWPILGVDVDNDGIGEPVIQHEKPILGFPVLAPQTDDDFSNETLGKQWEWNHNPRSSFWSLTERPGWLRLKAGMPITNENAGPGKNNWTNGEGGKTAFWRVYNTLSQRIMGTTTGTATACFDLSNMTPGQRSGFVRFGGLYYLLGIKMEETNKKRLFFMNPEGEESLGQEIKQDVIYIRTKINGNQAYFEFSLDGKIYQSFGSEFTLKFGKWTGDRLGFFCWNEREETGYVDVDWFTYDYDGPKAGRSN